MESLLKQAQRKFVEEDHIANLLEGEWVPLFDQWGNELDGIRGRMGVAAMSMSGHEIGVDYIEMDPGAAFPLHDHPGDHILYVIENEGVVHAGGEDHRVRAGDSIFIAAEDPHGVKALEPPYDDVFRFLAFGHPHKHVSAEDRMHVLDEEYAEEAKKKAADREDEG